VTINCAEDETEGSSKKRAALDAGDHATEVTAPAPESLLAPSSVDLPKPELELPADSEVKVEPIDTRETAQPVDGEVATADGESSAAPALVTDLPVLPGADSIPAPAPTPTPEPEPPLSKFEEPQNRFRIYFDSPPELDRIPKAIRRGTNKRFRRESSSVAPSVQGQAPAEGEAEEKVPDGGVEAAEAETVVGEAPAGVEVKAEVEAEEVVGEVLAGAEVVDGEVPVVSAEAEPSDELGGKANAAGDAVAEVAAADSAAADAATGGAEEDAGAGDVSMRTDVGQEADAAEGEQADLAAGQAPEATAVTIPQVESVGEASAEAPATDAVDATSALPSEAEAVPARAEQPIATRTRRRSSVSSHATHPDGTATVNGDAEASAPSAPAADAVPAGPQPSVNRISILYEESSRRICVDAEAVESVRIYRAEGKIEVCLKEEEPVVSAVEGEEEKEVEKVEGDLRKGILVS
jgi:hypothetical protein